MTSATVVYTQFVPILGITEKNSQGDQLVVGADSFMFLVVLKDPLCLVPASFLAPRLVLGACGIFRLLAIGFSRGLYGRCFGIQLLIDWFLWVLVISCIYIACAYYARMHSFLLLLLTVS